MEQVLMVAIVLHYMNVDDTIECVDSFLRNTHDCKVIVVDNASPNETGGVLKDKYKSDKRVVIIINDQNLGFSAGNNVGIDYAREHFDFLYLILANNDTCILDDQLEKKICDADAKYGFAVMGPMILTADGRCDSNPIFDFPYTREKAIHDLEFHKELVKAYKNNLTKKIYFHKRKVLYYRNKVLNIKKKEYVRKNGEEERFLHSKENVVLHGSFLVLSKRYFSTFKGLDARTFMYAEEDILYRHCQHEGLMMLYYPSLVVYHKEDRSVRRCVKNEDEKKLRFSRQAIKSIQSYIDLLDEYNIE